MVAYRRDAAQLLLPYPDAEFDLLSLAPATAAQSALLAAAAAAAAAVSRYAPIWTWATPSESLAIGGLKATCCAGVFGLRDRRRMHRRNAGEFTCETSISMH